MLQQMERPRHSMIDAPAESEQQVRPTRAELGAPRLHAGSSSGTWAGLDFRAVVSIISS